MKAQVMAVLLVGLVASASAILGGPDCPGCPQLTQQQVQAQQQSQQQTQQQAQPQVSSGARLAVYSSPFYSTGIVPSVYSARVVPTISGIYPYYARI
ncbi:cuticle protein 9.5-like isoform X1 [Schistocerca nitens]|uniref:cuticle protein 9.5-like isoform X1 n=1 Tax=Schistocerca nitens TaxID=7011 RepID=UPI00211973A1|nr:cuticle protein 9.5-like isoform X1 [Schistocerca nitens]